MKLERARNSVTVVRTVSASPHDVFAAWTRPDLLEKWGVDTASVDPRVGGRFRQETRAADGQHVVSGEYREFVPDRRLVMTWNHRGPLDAEPQTDALVTVDLRALGPDKTEVSVTEEPIPAAERTDAEAAWGTALDALEALLAGTIRGGSGRPTRGSQTG